MNEASSSWQETKESSPAVLLFQLFAGHSDHHAVGKGRLEAVPGKLANHLTDSQAVILPHMVQEPQCVVLENRGSKRQRHVSPKSTCHAALGFMGSVL
jgi:hypothetical protein